MSIGRCNRCGLVFKSSVFFVTNMPGAVTFNEFSTSCPRCETMVSIDPATIPMMYEVAGKLLSEWPSQEKLSDFASLVSELNSGQITQEEALARSEQFGGNFTQVMIWINANSPALGLFVSILALLVSFWGVYVADNGTSKTPPTALEIEKLIERALPEADSPISPPRPASTWSFQEQRQLPVRLNRKERRRLAAKSRSSRA